MNEFKGKEYIIAETQEENLNQSTQSTKLNLKKINDDENQRQIIFSGDGSRYHHKCKMESQNYNFNKDYFSRTMTNKNTKQQGSKFLEFNKNKSVSPNIRKSEIQLEKNKQGSRLMNRSNSELRQVEKFTTDNSYSQLLSMDRRLNNRTPKRNDSKTQGIWKPSGGNQASLKLDTNVYMLTKN
eukprot:403368166